MSISLSVVFTVLALGISLAGCGPRRGDQAVAGGPADGQARGLGLGQATTKPEPPTAAPTAVGRAADEKPTPDGTATPRPAISPSPKPLPPPHTPRPSPFPTLAAQAYINVAGLNFRAGPGLRHQSLEVIGKATPLALSGRNEDGSWVVVRLPAEINGWVASSYLTFTEPISIMTLPLVPIPSAPPPPTPTPPPMDPAAPIVLAPPVVAQGDAVLVRVRQGDLRQVQASLGEQVIDLMAAGPEVWAGYLPVPVDTPPGPYPVHLTLVNNAGDASSGEVPLSVVAGQFKHEAISLSDDLQGLINSGEREVESARLLAEVWSRVTPERLWTGRWRFPSGGLVSSLFGVQRDYTGTALKNWHTGLDFRGPTGAPVYAAARGRVALAERLKVRGNCIWLDHGWGVYSGYFHLSKINVAVGDLVEQGRLIGHIGATGMVTGAHLHFEVRVHGAPVQPVLWLARDMAKLP